MQAVSIAEPSKGKDIGEDGQQVRKDMDLRDLDIPELVLLEGQRAEIKRFVLAFVLTPGAN